MSSSEQVYRPGAGAKVTGRPAGASADVGGVRAAATATAPSGAAPGRPAAAASTARVDGRTAPGAAAYPEAQRAAAPATGGVPVTGPRKVRLSVARVDPWSVLKLSFLLSVALGIVLVTASVVLWSVFDATGAFAAANTFLRTIGSANTKFDINQWVGLGRVVSLATVIAVVNVIIIMALSTLGAVLYNIASSLVGGLQVTLSDD